MRSEFTGAVLIPLLSECGILNPINISGNDAQSIDTSYSNIQDLLNSGDRISELSLQNWLSDVLNGVRGCGELILQHPQISIVSSLAMEAFLYRNTSLYPANDETFIPGNGMKEQISVSNGKVRSLRNFLATKPFQCLNVDTATKILNEPFRCGEIDDTDDPIKSKLGDLEAPINTHDIQMHNTVLESYRILLMHRQHTATQALRRLKHLINIEMLINTAWKRMAVALVNLLSFECEIGKSPIGDTNDVVPDKEMIEDELRIFSRQKHERFLPQLMHLQTLIASYSNDLAQVRPSFDALLDAIGKVVGRHDPKKIKFTPGKGVDWKMIKELAAQRLQQNETKNRSDAQLEEKLRNNEAIISDFLKMLVRGIPIRSARTAYKYFKMEANQCMSLSNSALSLAKVSTVTREVDEIEEKGDALYDFFILYLTHFLFSQSNALSQMMKQKLSTKSILGTS